MSDVDFNALLWEVSKTVEVRELPYLKCLCRGFIRSTNIDNINSVWDLLLELVNNGNLGPDNLEVLKDAVKYVRRSKPLLGAVEEFENARKGKVKRA